MRFVIITTAVLAVAFARPGTYKENEEFKYARSSSDEGSKTGFYEAQRGNVGGNFEKAHNMDNPAQKTMSQAIQQVDGVIGDPAKLTHGDFFNTGSSRGVYSQGQYDLSNLQGRNFQESGYQGKSASHSALNSGYNRQSSHLGYGGNSEAYRGSNYKLQGDDWQAPNQFNSGYHESGKESAHHSEYRSENNYRGNNLDYPNSGAYYTKSASPTKLLARPGVAEYVPISVLNNQASHYQAHSANQEVESAINTEVNYPKPAEPKHYESSYEYKKQWEKHESKPVPAPLGLVPVVPIRSELYDENTLTSGGGAFQANDLDQHREFNKYRSASKSESRHESEYNRHVDAVNSNAGFRTIDSSGLAALTENKPSRYPEPKKYESSYSYHKSWERQGDPYVIKPAEAIESQRLTAPIQGYGSYSRQQGSQHRQSHSSYTQGGAIDCNCDEEQLRARRSVDSHKERVDPYQQSQVYEGQQVQSEHLEDFGQETQSAWDLREFSQQSGKLEDIGQQQTEDLNNFSKHGSQNKWNSENMSQQQQSNWDHLRSFDQQGNVNNVQLQKPHPYNLHRDLELPHDTPKSSIDSNDYNNRQRNVGTVSSLLTVDDTQQTHNGNHGTSLTSLSDSNSNQYHFRQRPGSNPFPTHYWNDVTKNTDQTMHGYNPNAFTSNSQSGTELKNQKPLRNIWDQISNSQNKYIAHSYGYESGQNSNFMVNSNNENNFRSQWQQVEDRKILESDFEKLITTTAASRNIFSGLGRGDIETDDVNGQDIKPKTNNLNRNIYDHTNTTPKQLKTSEEIESLSQTKPHKQDNEPNTEELGVLSIQQKHDKNPIVSTTTSSKLGNSYLDINETQSSGLQQNIEQKSTDFGQEIQTGMTWEENVRDFNPNQSADDQRFANPQPNNSYRHQTEQRNQQSDNIADNLSQQHQSGWADGIQESNLQLQRDLYDFDPNNHKTNTVILGNRDGHLNSQMHLPNSDQVNNNGEKNAEIIESTQSTTEQPGFWKSVGNKFVSAKDKVSSWFKS